VAGFEHRDDAERFLADLRDLFAQFGLELHPDRRDRVGHRDLSQPDRRNGAEVPIDQALEEGHIVVELAGHKLPGGYALTRTGVDRRGRERWLLVKKRDLAASDAHRDILSTRPESVLSGRTVQQVAAQDR
jgi:hypothetical protein